MAETKEQGAPAVRALEQGKEWQTTEWLHVYAVTTPLEKLLIAGSIQVHSSEAGCTTAFRDTRVSEAGCSEQKTQVLQNK